MIENEGFNCAKMVSCKVMTIKTHKGYRWYQGHWELLGVLGAIRGHQGVGVSGVYWGADRECRYSGPQGVLVVSRGIGGFKRCWGLLGRSGVYWGWQGV